MTQSSNVLCAAAAALALCGLSASAVSAASGPGIWLPPAALKDGVSITGLIDTGFRIHHHAGKTDVRMQPNGDETSAFHIRARESLGNGRYVRMKLSAPFKPDSGEFNNGSTILFNEAFVAVGGEWGEVAVGRLANIFSGNGDFGLCPQINPSPMGTNFTNASLTPTFSSGYYFNNSVIYNTPRINGFHAAVMYSNGRTDDSVARSKSDQFAALALTWKGEKAKLAVMPTFIDNDSLRTADVKPNDERGSRFSGAIGRIRPWAFTSATSTCATAAPWAGAISTTLRPPPSAARALRFQRAASIRTRSPSAFQSAWDSRRFPSFSWATRSNTGATARLTQTARAGASFPLRSTATT